MKQCLYDEGIDYKVKTVYDGAVYNLIGEDCVIGNIGDEFEIEYVSTSLAINVLSGFGFIGGGYFSHDTAEQIEADASSILYLCARIDKTRPNGTKAQIKLLTEAEIKSEDLNGGGNIRDLILYKITSDASGITGVEDMRKIKTSHGKHIDHLTIQGTPSALAQSEPWDKDGEYTHYLDVQVIGVYESDYLSNYVFDSDFEGSSVVRTLRNKIRFFFTSADAVNSQVHDVVIIGK